MFLLPPGWALLAIGLATVVAVYLGLKYRLLAAPQVRGHSSSLSFELLETREMLSAVPTTILPGAKVYDVTAYGATPNNAADDDSVAINAAIQEAADFVGANYNDGADVTLQQVIYLPEGVYHVANSVIFPDVFSGTTNRNQTYLWIYGQGEESSVLRLKEASSIGQFGTSSSPKPVLQIAEYDRSNTFRGNTNRLLWATNLGIEVPSDQSHAVGLSFGAANTGGVRNMRITAEGGAGRTGLALVQYNNGPGLVTDVTIVGFDIGLEVSDGWAEQFNFQNITVIKQNPGGMGAYLEDKMLAIENFASIQDEDIPAIRLSDDGLFATSFNGKGFLTLVNANLTTTAAATVPAIEITAGHSYLRNIMTSGYGDEILVDHGTVRSFANGDIAREYISVHGKTDTEESNVIVDHNGAPEASLGLPILPTPEVSQTVWNQLALGNHTTVNQSHVTIDGLGNPQLNFAVTTDWILVDSSMANDDTNLIQAALNSAAKYIGLLNNTSHRISKTLVVNGDASHKSVELIYGYVTNIFTGNGLTRASAEPDINKRVVFRLETGNADTLFIKGFDFPQNGQLNSDRQIFVNNSSQTLVVQDLRALGTARAYRNGGDSFGANVFFENVEVHTNGLYQDDMFVFDHQHVWARQFNLEQNVSNNQPDFYSVLPDVINIGGDVWIFGSKVGEYNGLFWDTRDGGRTEVLGAYLNLERVSSPDTDATNWIVADSFFSFVGQERVRNINGNPLPHGNIFGIVEDNGSQEALEGTSLPTNHIFSGYYPFSDTSYSAYENSGHYRVVGLFRTDDVPEVVGDYDRSGTVDEDDFKLWKSTFGSTNDLRADGNGNQIVDAADYTVWRDNLNSSMPEAENEAGNSAVSTMEETAPHPPPDATRVEQTEGQTQAEPRDTSAHSVQGVELSRPSGPSLLRGPSPTYGSYLVKATPTAMRIDHVSVSDRALLDWLSRFMDRQDEEYQQWLDNILGHSDDKTQDSVDQFFDSLGRSLDLARLWLAD